jgi:hypothetical protein
MEASLGRLYTIELDLNGQRAWLPASFFAADAAASTGRRAAAPSGFGHVVSEIEAPNFFMV